MKPPHCVQYGDAEGAPLYRDVQGLIVRISDDLARSKYLRTRSGLLEKPTRRSGAVSNDRCLSKEPQGFLPEFQSQADRGRFIAFLVKPIILSKSSGLHAQSRRS